MIPWRYLNLRGKILILCVPINIYVAIIFAMAGDYIAILPVLIAMVCGLSTYNKKYQNFNINEQKKSK
jgi:hypothetical protein